MKLPVSQILDGWMMADTEAGCDRANASVVAATYPADFLVAALRNLLDPEMEHWVQLVRMRTGHMSQLEEEAEHDEAAAAEEEEEEEEEAESQMKPVPSPQLNTLLHGVVGRLE